MGDARIPIAYDFLPQKKRKFKPSFCGTHRPTREEGGTVITRGSVLSFVRRLSEGKRWERIAGT